MCENKYLKQAREELAYLSGDPDFQRLLESRAGFLMDMDMLQDQVREEGLAEGRAKGLAEGKRKNQIEIAKKLLELNIPIDKISVATGLAEKEIKEL